MKILYWKK